MAYPFNDFTYFVHKVIEPQRFEVLVEIVMLIEAQGNELTTPASLDAGVPYRDTSTIWMMLTKLCLDHVAEVAHDQGRLGVNRAIQRYCPLDPVCNVLYSIFQLSHSLTHLIGMVTE